MNIGKLFSKKKTVYAFEIFPPKKQSSIDTVYDTLEALGDLSPDYISVTYGAGGSVRNNKTAELADMIKSKLKIEPLAHLTCVNSTREEIDIILENLKELQVQNILALRGDISPDGALPEDFHHACDLIRYIKEHSDFNIAAACYPEKHLEAGSMDEDIQYLKEKTDLGVGHLISQLFFDNGNFYRFLDKIRQKGISVPVEAGIMPITSAAQIEKMTNMCGALVPEQCRKMIERYGDDHVAMRDAGIIYATNQIMDLVANGVDGVHIYTMNNPYVARKITLSIGSLLHD